jgi:hypothetical protein
MSHLDNRNLIMTDLIIIFHYQQQQQRRQHQIVHHGIINDTLNIKRFTLRHTHGKTKHYRTTFDENNHRKLSTSMTTQNFHDLIKSNNEKLNKRLQQENSQRHMNFKKSFSLFQIKQPLTDSTNKDIMIKSINNNTMNTIKERDEEEQQQQLNSIKKSSNDNISHKQKELSTQENQTTIVLSQHKRRHKFEMTTGEYDSYTRLQLILPIYQYIIISCFNLHFQHFAVFLN